MIAQSDNRFILIFVVSATATPAAGFVLFLFRRAVVFPLCLPVIIARSLVEGLISPARIFVVVSRGVGLFPFISRRVPTATDFCDLRRPLRRDRPRRLLSPL